MPDNVRNQTLRMQRICGTGLLLVGLIHTAAHFFIPQARYALFNIIKAGLFNTLGTDWATANFSVLMSLVVGFLIIITGMFIFQTAKIPWKISLSASISVTLLFIFIVIAGPNGGGWLGAFPFAGYYYIKP